MGLPENIECEQDIEDVYAHFEQAANEYVRRRLPFKLRADFRGRFFIVANDLRFISTDHVEELGLYLGSDQSDTIVMRAALNAIKSFYEMLWGPRWAQGLRLDPKYTRCDLSTLLITFEHHEVVAPAIKQWREDMMSRETERKNAPKEAGK